MPDPNHRLVKRYETAVPVELTWSRIDNGRRRLRRHAPVPAFAVDISVSGMQLELPFDTEVEVGERAQLISDDHTAIVRVVRVDVDEQRHCRRCGVEIIDMSEEFGNDLNAVVAALRGDSGQLAELWARR